MNIRAYNQVTDEDGLMQMLRDEGEDWSVYWAEQSQAKYRIALAKSITYVAEDNGRICGYSRSIEDCGFYIYVCDLLLRSEYRGQALGRKLMERIYYDYPEYTIYVMSDLDAYYKSLAYRREGSVFEVSKPQLDQ